MKVFEEAFIQGESATMYILGEMLKTQAEVAPELSPYAPLIMSMQIAESQIRTVIGKGWTHDDYSKNTRLLKSCHCSYY